MVSRTAKEWYQITKIEFDPAGLIHLATDNAQHSIFTSLLKVDMNRQGNTEGCRETPPWWGYCC